MSRRALASAAALCIALCAAAQTRPYDRALRGDLWLAGTNAAGLRSGSGTDISYAELSGSAATGGLHRTWESPSPWEAGAEARTVKHLERFSMKGGFSFGQMSGRDMCGSMSLRPGWFPLDAIEFTPGRKTRQTYAFDGGLSVDIADGLRFGAMMDFTSANYAKRKDLRHTNYLLDLTFSPGITYTTPSGDMTFGANYIYRKTSESLVAEQVGTGESSYYAFLDKGLMYGKYEVWSGSGVHLDEAGVQGFPQREQFHGLGLEMGAGQNYHAAIEYLYGSGTAGEKQTVWYRFPSHNVNVRLASVFDVGDRKLYLRGSWGWRYQTNSETVLEKVVSGGVTVTEEHGSNRILSRATSRGRLEAEVDRPGFTYIAAVEAWSMQATASQMYPFIAESDLVSCQLSFAPAWYKGAWDFGGSVAVGLGSVREDSLRLDAEDSGVVTAPFRLESWYDLETEYLKATKVRVSAFLRRNFAHGIYVETEGGFLQALPADFPGGAYRAKGRIALGWTF